MKVKAVKFKIKRERIVPPAPPERLGTVTLDEKLTGFVQGLEASSYEERFARALAKNPNVEGYSFREHFFGPSRITPGAIEVDFIVTSGPMEYPIQIDGEYAHGSQVSKNEDSVKDARLNAYFKKYGNVAPVQRVPDRTLYRMGIFEDQEKLDEFVGDMFR